MSKFATQFQMLDTLITSKTRIKLLLKFFLNSSKKAYLRGMEAEFGESSNAIRLELNRFEEAGLLNSTFEGNKKYFCANTKHPMYKDINSIMLKFTGIDKLVEKVVNELGDLKHLYLVGDLAKGLKSDVIDIVLVGDIDKVYLFELIGKVEDKLFKKVKYVAYKNIEFSADIFVASNPDYLLLWSK